MDYMWKAAGSPVPAGKADFTENLCITASIVGREGSLAGAAGDVLFYRPLNRIRIVVSRFYIGGFVGRVGRPRRDRNQILYVE